MRRPQSEQSDRDLIVRHDSSLSAMRCLLGSDESQTAESQDPPETPSPMDVMQTPQDPPVTPSSKDTPVTPASEDVAETPETPLDVPETPETPDLSTETPETPCTDSSPAEAAAPRYELVEHSLHAALEIKANKVKRLSLRTRAPRLWRHGCKIYESFCSYSGRYVDEISNVGSVVFNVFLFVHLHIQLIVTQVWKTAYDSPRPGFGGKFSTPTTRLSLQAASVGRTNAVVAATLAATTSNYQDHIMSL